MKNKVIVVTGASSGIGLALARLFVSKGAKVVLAARSLDKLLAIEASFSSQAETLVVATDVGVENDCKNLIDKTIEKFGTIDVLINNAGVSMRALFKNVDVEVLKQLMDVNFWGTVYCTKYALPYLLKNKGSVVGISSIAGFVGLPGRTGYSASKFAMNGFLEALRVENLKTGLHVLLVAPGFTASQMRFSSLTEHGKPQGKTPRNESKMMTAEAVADCTYRAIKKRKRVLILTFIEGKVTVFLKKWMPTCLERMTFKHISKEDPEFLA